MNKTKPPPRVGAAPRRRKKDAVVYVHREDRRNRISLRVLFTLFLAFAVGISSALYYAMITDLQSQINRTRTAITEQRELNTAFRAEITQKYTLDEVERVARDELGMSRPDGTQVVRISVPKQSYVVLNDEDNPEYSEESLLDGILSFLKSFWSDLTS